MGLGSLDSSGRLNSWFRYRTFVDIKHSANLYSCISLFVERRFWELLSESLFFVLYERDYFGRLIIFCNKRFVGAILHLMDFCFCFPHWIHHFLENSFLFAHPFLSAVAFTYQSVILRLILEVAWLNFFKHFCIAFLENFHIFHQIFLMVQKLLSDLFLPFLCLCFFLLFKLSSFDSSFQTLSHKKFLIKDLQFMLTTRTNSTQKSFQLFYLKT